MKKMNSPVKIGPTTSFKSHRAEDIRDIPHELLDHDLHQSTTSDPVANPPHIFRALAESRNQGKRPVPIRTYWDLRLMEMMVRLQTFCEDSDGTEPLWQGPSAVQMSWAGFRRVPRTNWAQCCYCEVIVRTWASDDDAWQKHKTYSPCCPRLLQVDDGGIHPSAPGKRQLRHSFSSYMILKTT